MSGACQNLATSALVQEKDAQIEKIQQEVNELALLNAEFKKRLEKVLAS